MIQGYRGILGVPRISVVIALMAVTVSVLALVGWGFKIPVLVSVVPGLATMKVNTALSFILCGFALGVLGLYPLITRILAAAVVLLGLGTLSQYLIGWDLGIDQALMQHPLAGGGAYPGRMSGASALAFVLLGSSLFFTDWGPNKEQRPSQWMALGAGLIAFLALLGYVFGVPGLYGVAFYNAMALHTAVTFVLMMLGVLYARPHQGLMRRLNGDDAGGLLLRRMVPAAICLPPLIGWVCLQGRRQDIYSREFAGALFTAAIVVSFTTLVWWVARAVRRTDFEKRVVHVKLQAQLGRLELLRRITHAIGERQDLDSIFQVVIRSLEADFPIDFGCICLYNEVEQTLAVRRVGVRNPALAQQLTGPSSAFAEKAHVAIGTNGLARCIRGEVLYEPDITDVKTPFTVQLAKVGLRSLVITPLKAEGYVTGVLITARRDPSSFTSPDCEFLQHLSEHVGLAVQQVQLHGALQNAYDEQRQSQQSVMQQERLRALGQMASGIAHDINNAISPVALYTESMIEHEKHLSATGRDHLITIQRAIDDVARTVSRMREFYRPREAHSELVRVSLNDLVVQTIDLTRARWSDMPQSRGIDIRMQKILSADLPVVLGSESEIRDALTNLIFNAIDAMLEGGTLTVRTAPIGALAACVEVSDTGCGMDDQTRRRCLEPFFTTKGERGTGLGLAMVYGMVQRHSAQLQIDSEVGKGTTVRVVFPAAKAPVTAAVMPAAVAPRALRALRILVIDDDPLLLESLRDAFESDGHQVTTADGGQVGIDRFRAALDSSEPFEVVVTDLGMPQIDGRKVAAAVRAASAAVPIILLTGWGQRLLAENDVPPEVNKVLSKPPRLLDLRTALAEVITDGD